MPDDIREELLKLLRTDKQIIDILYDAYQLGEAAGYQRGVLDDQLKELLG